MTVNDFSARQTRRRPRLAVAVVEDLVTAIVTEVYPAGSALPPENVLCDMFEVSRTVVREATTALTEKGLVVSQQGRGTIVQGETYWNRLDPMVLGALFQREDGLSYLDNLVEIRVALEASMAAKVARKATDAELAELRAQMDKLAGMVADPAAYIVEDVVLHHMIMRISGDRLSEAIIDGIQGRALSNFAYAGKLSVEHIRDTHDAHQKVYDAILARDPDGAARAMRDHIESSWRKRRPKVIS
ncbi:FadR/GntR family transcriptional regulator [Asticcacaulis sp. BYS171W]|uniref:FadR/GntR family transcriptional regulator n=1 Tax=Asticcacaulis aquaticus TaxID=2984212 RepID=A0ABT5HVR7_9CAUL|nr:FadR/GntR family transcriptional regulator [Asticcacaulis aquaticus]MDC7684153.1 FadR/GntR family transcriptional regulator [Asticcacaulis aquaticus]